MVYEIYLDSILLEVLFWNYCVLSLTNAGFCRTSKAWKIFLGSIAGAFGYILPLLLPLPPFGRIVFAAGSCAGALWFTFSVKNLPVFLKVLGNYLKYALLLGGSMLLVQRMPFIKIRNRKLVLSLLILGLMTAAGMKIQRRISKDGGRSEGRATLIRKDKKICVDALVDSGNSLTEPISGRPVCVLDQDTAQKLWGEAVLREEPLSEREEPPFRVIPYRSVGQKKGVMKAYLLPEMRLELGGPAMTFYDVYMAVSPQELTKEEGKTQVLIHPEMISQDRQKRQAGKEREGYTK